MVQPVGQFLRRLGRPQLLTVAEVLMTSPGSTGAICIRKSSEWELCQRFAPPVSSREAGDLEGEHGGWYSCLVDEASNMINLGRSGGD